MTKISRLAATARRRVRGEEDAEQGFTLIELLVVLLIIGILLAIAIPTFLSVTKSANNTAAESNLQTALTGAKTWYTENNQTYTGISLASIDTGLSVVTGTAASTTPHAVSVDKGSTGVEVAIAAFATGTHDCWGIVDFTSPASAYGQTNYTGSVYVESNNATTGTGGTCKGSLFYATTGTPTGVGYSLTGFSSINNPKPN